MAGNDPRQFRLVDDVAPAFADVVAGAIAESSGPFRLALSGGETARQCYDVLASRAGIDWSRVECFLGDERCVPPDDDDANQKMIRSSLIDKVSPAGFYPMDCSEAEAYEALLAERGPLDIVHLGLGPDGHTASLFPESPGLEAPPGARVVHNFDETGRNPHRRLSLSFEEIARSRLALFTVAGESKKKALHRVLAGEDLPATRVRAGEVVFLCDREAMGEAAP